MTSYEWSPPYPAWVYVVLTATLAGLLLAARVLARSPTARRWSFLLLRGSVLALVVGIFLNLVRVTENRQPPRLPEVVFLVDCSRSMALDRPVSRLERIKQILVQKDRAVSGARLSLYRFGSQLAAVTGLNDLSPTDEATRLFDSLERLTAHFGADRPAGVVVFSDGRLTETTDFEEITAGYRRLGVPVHVFPVGSQVAGDVAIHDVIAPRDAPPGARLPVRVVVHSRGYPGRRAELRIRSVSDPARPPLATLPITLADGEQTHELLIDQETSGGRLVVEVPPLEGEAILENNQVPFEVASRKKKIRVIYMEGSTNNESHYVRDALVEDPNIECLVMEVDDQYLARPRLFRVNDRGRGYPTTREELFGYDVVICSDISRGAFTQEQLNWTAELVGQRGGGFAMVGGNTSFGAGFWDQTVWDGLIPVIMSGSASSVSRGILGNIQFKVKVPQEVERHPICASWRIRSRTERSSSKCRRSSAPT